MSQEIPSLPPPKLASLSALGRSLLAFETLTEDEQGAEACKAIRHAVHFAHSQFQGDALRYGAHLAAQHAQMETLERTLRAEGKLVADVTGLDHALATEHDTCPFCEAAPVVESDSCAPGGSFATLSCDCASVDCDGEDPSAKDYAEWLKAAAEKEWERVGKENGWRK